MKMNFLIAPDFAPERFGGWHILNTVVQRRAGIQLHLLTPVSAHEQSQLLAQEQVDLIYANPFDAADLVREHGYVPFARPAQQFDEMVIASGADGAIRCVEDLKPGCRIAMTDNKDVKLIGLRCLEPADLTDSMVTWVPVENYQAGARKAIKGEVDATFFLAGAYAALGRMSRSQLRVLVESAIHDISHVLLVHPRAQDQLDKLAQAFLSVQPGADADLCEALGLPNGFEAMNQEDIEFMIDLMDTLLD